MKKLLLLMVAGLACTILAQAGTITGTLYYTTFAGGTNVHSVNYSYNGTSIVYSSNVGITGVTGADGILFAPDGNLLVAGQGANHITELTTAGVVLGTVAAGTGSYHMALSSDASNATLFNLWNGPGSGGSDPISAVTLTGGSIVGAASGVPYTIVGTGSHDVRGLVYDPANSTWYYGTAPDGAAGDFGTVSFSGTTATLTLIASGKFAHGLTYDSFASTIIFSSQNVITQYNPGTGTFTDLPSIPDGNYDQSAVDGNGHLFVASNSGDLVFVDYSSGGFASPVFTDAQFLAASLDDIAPLSGSGSSTVPEPASFLLLGTGLAGVLAMRRKVRS
jgi:hypothetical protein